MVGEDMNPRKMSRSPNQCDVKTRNLSEKKRRDQFNMLINELCLMVSTNNRKMDKSTVLKSTIAFLKNYQEISVQSQAHEIKENWKPSFLSNDEFTQLMLEALDSFLLVFTQQGNILYASESVTSLLGHLPIDLTNKSIYDFVHENEKMNMYNLITTQSALSGEGTPDFEKDDNQMTFTCHVKRGLLVPSDPQIYEFVKVSGNFRHWSGDPGASPRDSDNESVSKASEIFSPKPTDTVCFCCTVRLNTSQLIREMSVIDESKTEFTSRHSMEWKFLFLDHRAPPIIGYLPFELLGTSGYDYYHPDDLEKISACHEHLIQTGEGNSCYYRFLTKGQQWIWLKTRYFISYHQWNCKPEFVVCTHTLASYADVRTQIRKEFGYSDEDLELGYDSVQSEFCQSDVCSVTSGDQLVSGWSSAHSLRSVTPERTGQKWRASEVEGSEALQTPHSTAQLSPRAMPQTESLSLTQPVKQAPAGSMMAPQTPPAHASTPKHPLRLSPLVSQSSMPATSISLSSSPDVYASSSELGAGQVYMTLAQRHLHDQLQRKSQLLQQAIRQQQEELRQITDQLCLAQPPAIPNVMSLQPGPVVRSPQQGIHHYATMLSQDTSHPSTSAATPPMSLLQQQEQQFIPFQLMQQPPQLLFSQPSNLPDSSPQSHQTQPPE